MTTPVYLEVGSSKVFACSLDWPGWCRAAKDEGAALAALANYSERYRPVSEVAGYRFVRSGEDLEVVERVVGNATTNFGAPATPTAADSTALTKAHAARLAALVDAVWTVLERTTVATPLQLRKGPRGGGRDRDKMVAHVADAEAAYFRKVGVTDGRAGFLRSLQAARDPQPDLRTKSWPWRYAARRVAWHALDHTWEMEDRTE